MRTHSLLLAFAILSGLATGACRVSRPNPEHCFHARGDETCAEVDPSLPFCVPPPCGSEPYGCVAELPGGLELLQPLRRRADIRR